MVEAKVSFLPVCKTWRKLLGSPWAGRALEEENAAGGTAEVRPEGHEKHTSKPHYKPESSAAFTYNALDITTLLKKRRKKAGP